MAEAMAKVCNKKAASSLLAGEWEIKCGHSDLVWGEAIITTLTGSYLVKRAVQGSPGEDRIEERHPCTFKASRTNPQDDIQVQWGKTGSSKMMTATLQEHSRDLLRWKINCRSNGEDKDRGFAQWRRKGSVQDGQAAGVNCAAPEEGCEGSPLFAQIATCERISAAASPSRTRREPSSFSGSPPRTTSQSISTAASPSRRRVTVEDLPCPSPTREKPRQKPPLPPVPKFKALTPPSTPKRTKAHAPSGMQEAPERISLTPPDAPSISSSPRMGTPKGILLSPQPGTPKRIFSSPCPGTKNRIEPYSPQPGTPKWIEPWTSVFPEGAPEAFMTSKRLLLYTLSSSYTGAGAPPIPEGALDGHRMSLTPPRRRTQTPPSTPHRMGLVPTSLSEGLPDGHPMSLTPPLALRKRTSTPSTPKRSVVEFAPPMRVLTKSASAPPGMSWPTLDALGSALHRMHLTPAGASKKRSLTPPRVIGFRPISASPQPLKPGQRSLTPPRTPFTCTPKKRKLGVPAPEFCSPEWKQEKQAHAGVSTPEACAKAYTVMEVVSHEHKDKVWQMHMQKAAFANEHEHVKARIFDNEHGAVHCRSWLLAEVGAASGSSAEAKPKYLAAVTVRLNAYRIRAGLAWAQVMNLSVSEERRGHGTRLFAGVEELLRREGVDTVVLYPVENNRATNFWASMGYAEQHLLPPEELDTMNGSLLPEGYMQKGEKILLPRWEKSLVKHGSAHMIHVEDSPARQRALQIISAKDESSWKSLGREQWPLWRKVAAVLSKLEPKEVSQTFVGAKSQREQLR